EGIRVAFDIGHFDRQPPRRELLQISERAVLKSPVNWISPGPKSWVFDLDALKQAFPDLTSVEWLKGKVSLDPEIEDASHTAFRGSSHESTSHASSVTFYVTQESIAAKSLTTGYPIEITESLDRLRHDHPDPRSVAFI